MQKVVTHSTAPSVPESPPFPRVRRTQSDGLAGFRAASQLGVARSPAACPMKYNIRADSAAAPRKKSGKIAHRSRTKSDVASAMPSNSVAASNAAAEGFRYTKSWTGPAKLRSTVGPSAERSSHSAIYGS